MVSNFSVETAQKIYGVSYSHQIMENGEIRFRLISSDGSSFIRTVAFKDGWQSAHYHKSGKEIYIVQEGWMVMATLVGKSMAKKRYGLGSIILLESHTHHNIYLPANAVILTVKYGMTSSDDWKPSAKLQDLSRKLSKQDLEILPLETVLPGG